MVQFKKAVRTERKIPKFLPENGYEVLPEWNSWVAGKGKRFARKGEVMRRGGQVRREAWMALPTLKGRKKTVFCASEWAPLCRCLACLDRRSSSVHVCGADVCANERSIISTSKIYYIYCVTPDIYLEETYCEHIHARKTWTGRKQRLEDLSVEGVTQARTLSVEVESPRIQPDGRWHHTRFKLLLSLAARRSPPFKTDSRYVTKCLLAGVYA